MKKLTPSEIEEVLKKAGLQITIQRLSLVSFILQADHPTAEEVIVWAKKHLTKVNTATVYNTLNTLEEKGIIKKIKFPHLNHFVYDHNTQNHYHLLDEKSGKLSDLPADQIQVNHQLKDFNISGIEILIKGSKK